MEIPLLQGYFLFSLTFIGGTIMSNVNLFGEVKFYTYVAIGDDNNERHKRVTLATVPCDYVDRHEVVAKFKAKNSSLNFKEIHAHFMASDYIS
jgi:hypothetical protein